MLQEIDFNISLEESGIEVQGGGLEGGVATGNDALKLLDNPVTKTNFINDLLEVTHTIPSCSCPNQQLTSSAHLLCCYLKFNFSWNLFLK